MKLSLKKLVSRIRSPSASRSSSRRRMEMVEVVTSNSDRIVKELAAAFKVFDKDGDGRISKSELGCVLRSLGDDMRDADLNEVMGTVDGDGDGFSELQEFISFHTGSTASGLDEIASTTGKSRAGDEIGASSEEKNAVQAAFNVFDVDKNGFICAEELHTVMRSLGDTTTLLGQCRHMINCVDEDGAHMVNFKEFQCLMSSAFVCYQQET